MRTSSNRRHPLACLALWLACALLLQACSPQDPPTQDKPMQGVPTANAEVRPKLSTLAALDRPACTIAVMSELLSTKEARKKLTKATYLELPLPGDCYTALDTKKVDAVVYDRPALEYAAFAREDFVVLPENIAIGHVAIGASKSKAELVKRVNAFIRQIREDGTYQKMYDYWVQSHDPKMPVIAPPKSPDGTLVIGIDVLNPPMAYLENSHPVGFDIDFSNRLAAYLNKKVEFRTIVYEGLIAALESGKIDLAIAQMDATSERRESIMFSDDYIDSPVAVLIRKEDYDTPYTRLADLEGKTVGTTTGASFEEQAKGFMPPHELVEFNQQTYLIAALEGNKIDAFYTDLPVGRTILNQRPALTCVPQKIPSGDYCFLFAKDRQGLCDEFSEEIKRMKADGTLEKLQDIWFSNDESRKTPQKSIESDRVLTCYALAESEPFAYVKDGKLIGYDLDVATLAANKLGYRLDIHVCDLNAVVECVTSGKADFACGCITDTAERRESALFSAPTYEGGIMLVVRKEGADVAEHLTVSQHLAKFVSSLRDSFVKTFIRESRWKLILKGLVITLVITVFSVLLGTVLSLPLCLACMSKRRILAWLGKHFISLIMGTPLLVILMILYYIVFAKVDIDSAIVAIIAFALDFAVYTSVTLQSGIEGIPRGQTEAALALGHRPAAAFLKFILPQAVRSILPVYASEIVSTLKSTSIVGYIAIMDLTKMGDIIRSRTYEAFFPLIAIAVIYFLAAKGLTVLLSAVEHRLDPAIRRNRMMKGAAK